MDTYTEAALRRTTEARVWNERRKEDDLLTPAQHTRDLCEEVIWWHNALNGTNITFADLMSQCRVRPIMNCRADCMRRIRHSRKWSYPRIAAYFGGMDHTTCLHHVSQKVVATKVIRKPKYSLEALKSKSAEWRAWASGKQAVGKLQPQTEATP